MIAEWKVGAVLHYGNFQFADGGARNKFLVVLGAKPGCDYLCALTTSKQWRMKSEAGCHHAPRTHFFLRGDGANFFRRDTWLVLSDPRTLSRDEVILKGMQGVIKVVANLEQNITGAIRNCLKASADISERELQLL